MEVHHHSHHEGSGHRKKWSHYFWEFFMLFLAVTLGFLVENMREHYVERHRVKEYARSLRLDLAADTGMIRLHINKINAEIRATDSLAAYLRGRKIADIRNIDLFTLSCQDRYPPYGWNRATLDQIKNSGSLRYFTNEKLVEQISAYDAFTHHLDEDYQSDETMGNHTTELRAQIVNMDYSKELWMGLRNNMDSVIRTAFYNEIRTNDSNRIIAKDLDQVKIFLNEKLNIRKHLLIRSDEELSALIVKCKNLIAEIQNEYHIREK